MPKPDPAIPAPSGNRPVLREVTLVIPTCNEEHYLPRLLESVGKQTLKPVDVIVADHHSRDRTPEIALGDGCRLVPGGTVAVGRNRGGQNVNTKLLVFMDADTRLEDERCLETAIRAFTRQRLDIAKCWALNDEQNGPLGRVAVWATNLRNAADVLGARVLGRVVGGSGFFIAIRRDVFMSLGGFDETLAESEDADFLQRAVRSGHRFGLLPCRVRLSGRRYDRMSLRQFLQAGACFLVYRLGTAAGIGASDRLLTKYQQLRGPLGGH